MNSMPSLAFVLPVTPGRAEQWSFWFEEILGPRRSEYHAFRRRLGLGVHRVYLQQTPQGERAIVYLQGDDLQRAFEELRTAQDPFAVWFRQRAKDLLDGLDLTQISPESMSRLVFDGPSVDEDEAHFQGLEAMERPGMISP